MESFLLLGKFLKYFMENVGLDIAMAREKNDVLITPKLYLQEQSKTLPSEQERAFLEELDIFTKRNDPLSSRERECISLCSYGKTAKEVARNLKMSPRTVEAHLAHAKEKLDCKNIKELIYKVVHQKNSILEEGFFTQKS